MSDLNPSGNSEEFVSDSEERTLEWAKTFSAQLKAGDLVFLSGNLGAGKTVVSRGISLGLGFAGHVHSPSYALVHEYTGGRLPLFHLDLYRLKPGADWEEIGLEHYFQQEGVCLVEWPERLPKGQAFTYRIEIETEGMEGRRIRVTVG
ncbi:MAG: tRNA (adenosine(37)-N6)-threonylcarbamoyltransferase complex ATPase subunit type 1 TsaE [Fibrobacterota bacterium]|nr:tRNA (adenosine(37)-N6)-threonylcarbamoyltransferase complex ATPase subunit type 1 TsaE [Fibrobacterota bacterium]